MHAPLVSMIIPTRNEEKNIGECLASIQKQSYKRKEIIVVDGGSTDRTRKIAKKYGATVLEEKPLRGPGNARNIGARKARGDIVFWIDADCTLDEHAISTAVKNLLKENLDGVVPLTVVYPTKKIIPNVYYAERLSSKIDVGPNFLKRKLFLKFLFNPNLGVGEDFELSQRIRRGEIKFKLIRDVITYHKEPDMKRLVSESRWWGRTYFSLLKRGGIKAYLSFFWIIIVSAILPLVVLSGFIPGLWVLSSIIIAIYLIYSIFKAIQSIVNGAKIKYAVLIPFFKILRYSLLLVGMVEGVIKKQKFKGD